MLVSAKNPWYSRNFFLYMYIINPLFKCSWVHWFSLVHYGIVKYCRKGYVICIVNDLRMNSIYYQCCTYWLNINRRSKLLPKNGELPMILNYNLRMLNFDYQETWIHNFAKMLDLILPKITLIVFLCHERLGESFILQTK